MFLLRIVAIPPKGKQLRVRVEKVSALDVSVRGLVLLRDLLSTTSGTVATRFSPAKISRGTPMVSGILPLHDVLR